MRNSSDQGFIVGRRWGRYVLGFAILETILLIFFNLSDGSDGETWTDWCIIVVSLLAAPTVAAILVSPGSQIRHWATGLGLLLFSSIGFSMAVWDFDAEMFITTGLFTSSIALLQACWIRWTSLPRWIVRPSTKRSRDGVSMKWLLAVTGMMAIGFGVMRLLDDPEVATWFFYVFAPAIAAAVCANMASAIPNVLTRRTFILVPATLLAIIYALVITRTIALPVEVSNDYGEQSWLLAPAASLFSIALVHLSFARMNSIRSSSGRAKGSCFTKMEMKSELAKAANHLFRRTPESMVGVRRVANTGRRQAFVVGPRWWVGVIGLAIVQPAAFYAIDTFVDADGDGWLAWTVLMIAIVGAPTLGAILISPGCRWWHGGAAIAIQLWFTGMVLWEVDQLDFETLVILACLLFVTLLLQTAWLRVVAIPRWIVRPSLRRCRNGVSMRYILLFVTFLAIGFAVIRYQQNPSDVLNTLVMFGGAILATVAGNCLAAVRRDRWRGISVAILGAIGGTLFYLFVKTHLSFSASLMDFLGMDQEELSLMVFLFPTLSMTIVFAVHRFMRRLERT